MKTNVAVVIPNFNGKDRLGRCLEAVLEQTLPVLIIVVENASTDGSFEFLQNNYPDVRIVRNPKNLGFAGGVNTGIKESRKLGCEFVALLNNDAIPEKNWLENLMQSMKSDGSLASVASFMLHADSTQIDSTGDGYSIWGLTYARQRDEPVDKAIRISDYVFGASAGAALYRILALEEVGWFDDDFFAYYEDTDLNFRLQIAGWKSKYCPDAVVSHMRGSTSNTMKGLTTYQTFKNLPFIFLKNIPARLLPSMLPRFSFAYVSIYINSLVHGRGWPATKGAAKSLLLLPKKLKQRKIIQKNRQVSIEYIRSLLLQDLPPSAHSLRKLRSFFIRGK
ncbi:MAG: glycosyltransferase family 2 protein [bacterium]|nr:glycosyltransferase family 2 protein [bacterium]